MVAKRYLVTGGSGFIGSALVRRLLADGAEVRVLDDESRGSPRRLAGIENELEYVRGDVRDPQAVQKAVSGVDAVCHLACVNGTRYFYSKPEVVLEVGVKGIVNVIDACISNGVGELILASSSEVYQEPPEIPTAEDVPFSVPDPRNPRYSYAGCKQLSELMVINYGRTHFERCLIFRPHNVYGPDMGQEHVIPEFVTRMKTLVESGSTDSRFPIQGSGEETRAFVYIDDFIDGLSLILEHGEHLGIYHIGTNEEITIRKLAILVGQYFNREIEIVPGALAEGGTPRRCPSTAKLESFGYAPRISIERGLALTAEWYVSHAADPAEPLRNTQ